MILHHYVSINGFTMLIFNNILMDFYIYVLCIFILFFVLMIIFSTNPIHVIFWFILTYLYSALLLLIMTHEYLSLTLIIIYIGAITIIFLFVIMMLDIIELKNSPLKKRIIPLTLILIVNTSLQIGIIENLLKFKIHPTLHLNWNLEELEKLNNLGLNLYTDFIILFILITILLIIGLIAVILLSLETNVSTLKQNLGDQQRRNNSWT